MKKRLKPFFMYPPFMALALYVTLLGYMIPEIRAAFSISLAEAGLFSTLQSVGTVVSVGLCFSVFSALNKAQVLLISTLVMGVCMVLFGVTPLLMLLYLLFFFIGVSSNIIDTLGQAMLADLSPPGQGFHIGAVQALWSAAGAAGPYLAILQGGGYKPVFIWLGVFTVLTAAVFVLGFHRELRAPLIANRQNFGGIGKIIRTFKKRGIKLVAITNFFHVFVQISLIFFISSYAVSLRGSEADGAFALSMVFVGHIIGRGSYALLSGKVPTRLLLPPANAVSFVAFVAMVLCGDPLWTSLLAGIGCIGFSMTIPALVVEACNIVPEDTAAATATVFFGFAIATFVAPPLVGAIGDSAGLSVALLITAAMILPVVVLATRIGLKKPE